MAATRDIKGSPRVYYQQHLFRVEIDGITWGGFQKCSEFERQFAVIEQWEGGTDYGDKDPGRVTFTDITLERAMTVDRQLTDWMDEVNDALRDGGRLPPQFKRTADIVMLGRDKNETERIRLVECWPRGEKIGPFDQTADANINHVLTLVFKKGYRVKAA